MASLGHKKLIDMNERNCIFHVDETMVLLSNVRKRVDDSTATLEILFAEFNHWEVKFGFIS